MSKPLFFIDLCSQREVAGSFFRPARARMKTELTVSMTNEKENRSRDSDREIARSRTFRNVIGVETIKKLCTTFPERTSRAVCFRSSFLVRSLNLLIYLKRPFLCLLTACIFNKEKKKAARPERERQSQKKSRVQYGF